MRISTQGHAILCLIAITREYRCEPSKYNSVRENVTSAFAAGSRPVAQQSDTGASLTTTAERRHLALRQSFETLIRCLTGVTHTSKNHCASCQWRRLKITRPCDIIVNTTTYHFSLDHNARQLSGVTQVSTRSTQKCAQIKRKISNIPEIFPFFSRVCEALQLISTQNISQYKNTLWRGAERKVAFDEYSPN